MSKKRTPFQYLIGGTTGGLCVVLVGHPFDTIKVQMQTFPGVYKNMFHVANSMIRKEGPLSLYKGMSAPLATIVPLTAIGFFSFGAGKQLVSKPGQENLTDLQLIIAGMFSGVCTTFVTAPGERIKCLLQSQSNKYKGFVDCVTKLWKEGGIRNIYLGTCATLCRDVPACATYYYGYEKLKSLFLGNSETITWQPFLAGGVAGMVTWSIALAPDAIKTRIQTSKIGTYPRGVRSVFPIVMKEGGFLALYHGMVPVLIRAFLANAACFYGLELSFILMDKYMN